MPALNDYTIERLADRAQIQDIMYRWCRAIDRLDFDAMRDLFHPDAIDRHGIYEGGIEGLIEWLQERHRTMPFAVHSVSNMLIEFAGPDTAIMETYCLAVQHHSSEGSASLAAIAGGAAINANEAAEVVGFVRYVDKFERRDGPWRIANRTVVWDAVSTRGAPADARPSNMTLTLGRRGRDDEVYQARQEVGL